MYAATVYSSLLLFTLIFFIFSKKMNTEGLPIRQERGIDKGILAGADFLSVFMRQARPDTNPTTLSYIRETRNPSTDETLSRGDRLNDLELKGRSNSDGFILAATTRQESDTTESITKLSSEKIPSLVAEANKMEFNVEESEPVTSKLNEFSSYPAEVHALTNSQFQQHLLYQPVKDITTEKLWERHERHYNNHQSFLNSFSNQTKTNFTEKAITTERNWETDEKSYLPKIYGQPEQNYEVDESASVMTNGRIHGVQPPNNPILPFAEDIKSRKNDQKVGYVVEGRNYRKYRVEERTSDGFIVGEYGVVSHNDGSLRGVRYTADGTINPRLIYDALMKFLAL